jgi:hypothetical protein
MYAHEAVWSKRVIETSVKMQYTYDYKNRQNYQLDDHHHVIDVGGLTRSTQQQPGDDNHDQERRWAARCFVPV